MRGLVYPILRVFAQWFGIFNVRWYGAKCDATQSGSGTDDTAAIQAAIVAAELVNGTVYIPGRCLVSSTLTVEGSITICGPGAAADTGRVVEGITGVASTDVFTATAHGFSNLDIVTLSRVSGGTGITSGTNYYVRNVTANTFQLSTSTAGAVLNFTTDVTAARANLYGGASALGYMPRGMLVSTSTSGDILVVTGNSATRNVHIHDLGFCGPSGYTSHTAGCALRLTNTISSIIERVCVLHKYDGIVVETSGTTWALSMKDIEIALIKHDGLSISGGGVGSVGHTSVQDAQISNGNGTRMTGAAVRLNGLSGGSFENIDAIGATKAYHIGNSVQCIYLYFRNCIGDTSTLPWHIVNCRLSEFWACYAATIALDGGTRGVQMDTNAQDLNWVGGTLGYFSDEGFYLDGCDNVNISGVQFATYSGGASARPFQFAGSTTRVSIKDCTSLSGDFAANVALGASGHTELWIEGNRFNSAITGTRTGTGNRIVNNRNDDI